MYGVDFNFKYPFVYLLIALVAGILYGEILSVPIGYFYGLPVLFCFCIFFRRPLTADLILLVAVVLLGARISNPPILSVSPETTYQISCRCEERTASGHYILSVGRQRFYLRGQYTDCLYAPGDSLHFCARFYPFRNRQHTGTAGWNQYIKQKKLTAQVVPVSEIKQKGHARTLLFLFHELRQNLVNKTALLIKDSTERSLITALCLGYKDDLDDNLRELFIHTGTIHLLSVSGLHTGAIYLMLLSLLKLLRLPGNKKNLWVLPLLWAYACLTGLSPSIVRAATILSFITISKIACRSYIPLNTIAASAFLTLIINPALIYAVSFQLSYSAYFGIIVLYPFLYRLIKLPPSLSKIYACCCVSIAAQLPTLPLCAYYFHTINLNGFLANLLAIPIATLLLYSGMIWLLLPFAISQYLIFIPQITAKILVRFLRYAEPFSFNVQDVYPSSVQMIMLYLCFCSFCLFLIQHKFAWLKVTIILLLAGHLTFISENIRLARQAEIVLFHVHQHSAILLNYQGFYTLLKNDLPEQQKFTWYIQRHKLRPLPAAWGFQHTALTWQMPYLFTAKDTICFGPSSPSPHTTVLVITNNISPEKLFPAETIHFPRLILSDGSLSPYYTRQWELFCRQNNIAFQSTYSQEYIRFTLK